MKCDICGNKISAVKIMSSRPSSVVCDRCGSCGDVSGRWHVVVVPMIVFTIFPYFILPNNIVLALTLLMLSEVLVFAGAFYAFVKISWVRSGDESDNVVDEA